MAEFLLELLSEEIPARMQLKAAEDLRNTLEERLQDIELSFESVQTFVTPRRLTAVIKELAAETPSRLEERRGPRVGAPEGAMRGFLKSAGVPQEACVQKDGYWYAPITTPAQRVEELLPDLIRTMIREFSWPKSMRWAGASQPWIRPLRRVLAVLDDHLLPFDLPEFGLTTTNQTVGHRFLSSGQFPVTTFQDYKQKLFEAKVILDHQERQKLILTTLTQLGVQRGYLLEPDENLLQEVAGLVEWPQPLLGEIEPRFLELPKAILSTSMRVHQKYFTFVDQSDKRVAPVFGLVANTIPSEGGALMLTGYQRVLTARLRDAEFFYHQDLKTPLDNNIAKLSTIIFHAKLGTLGQRVERLQQLVDRDDSKRAALLCKADLVTGIVGEFPELQGIMGEIYALAQGESPAVARAIREHYQPLGPTDACPSDPASWELALAEKLDMLVGFFAIGELPTGSKDPYALRRAALGIIRLLREGSSRSEGQANGQEAYPLTSKIHQAYDLYRQQGVHLDAQGTLENVTSQVLQFIFDRIGPALRSEGVRHDAITAVLRSPNCGDDIWSIVERAQALNTYLSTDSGLALQTAFRRAYGILSKEGQLADQGSVTESLFQDPLEEHLHRLLLDVGQASDTFLREHDYEGLMGILAGLREPLDRFFDLKINHENPAIRTNRFRLLRLLVNQINKIADLSKLEG